MLLTLLKSWVSTATGSGGGAKSTSRKRYVVDSDGNLHQFDSVRAALAYANKRQETRDAEPVFSVPLEQVRQAAQDRSALDQFNSNLQKLQYDALLSSYKRWRDEQDIEDILMMI